MVFLYVKKTKWKVEVFSVGNCFIAGNADLEVLQYKLN